MFKKIIGIVIAFILLLSLAGCNNLVPYKASAKTEIQNHVDAKLETDYSFENWDALLLAAESGKAAVDVADNKAAVDIAVTETKQTIDKILPAEQTGLDTEIEGAIIQAYLETRVNPNYADATIKDVRLERYFGIYKYFVNEPTSGEGRIYGSFMAVQLNDRFNKYTGVKEKIFFWENETILTWTEIFEQNKIFDSGALNILATTDLDIKTYFRIREFKSAWLYEYYGTYSGAVVILFDLLSLPDVFTETIAGFDFYYGNRNRLQVFKDDVFYRMQEAYDSGFLTDDDVAAIYHIYKFGRPT